MAGRLGAVFEGLPHVVTGTVREVLHNTFPLSE